MDGNRRATRDASSISSGSGYGNPKAAKRREYSRRKVLRGHLCCWRPGGRSGQEF